MRGEQELGITISKKANPGDWYAEVIKKAEIADYASVGGFIVAPKRTLSLGNYT